MDTERKAQRWADRLTVGAFCSVGIACLIGLAAFAYLGTFSRYGADDYCFSRTIQNSNGPIDAAIRWYMNSSNRYTAMLEIALSEQLGRNAIRYLPVIGITAWVTALTYLFAAVSRNLRLKQPRLTGLTAAALIAFFAILTTPNRYQSVFWRPGLVTYFMPLVIFALVTGFILRQSQLQGPQSHLRRMGYFVFIAVAAFLAGGMSETTLSMQGGALGLAIILVILLASPPAKRSALPLLIIALIFSIAALLTVFVSPANAMRTRAFGPSPDVPTVVEKSLVFGVDFVRESFRSQPTAFSALIFIALGLGFLLSHERSALPGWRKLALLLALSLAVTYMLIFFSMLPSMYGQHSYPGQRSLMAATAMLVAGTAFAAGLIGASVHDAVSPRLGIRAGGAICLAASGLLLISALYPVYAAAKLTNQLAPYYGRIARQWDARDAAIQAAAARGERNIIVEQLDSIEGVIEYKSSNWVNSCAAEFYGVDSITAPLP